MYARAILGSVLLFWTILPVSDAWAQSGSMLIDDFSDRDLVSKLGTQWRGVSDQVMGGVSIASISRDNVEGRSCLRLSGDVRLENNGGFIQAALDLSPGNDTFDATDYTGVRLIVRGNDEQYSVHLRTPDNVRPWQSYRAHFIATREWANIDLPFTAFLPYRLDAALDIARLRRIGLVAIGRAFQADLTVCQIAFYL
ncbi:MAG: hypothetical protein ACI8W7_005096 [Gammaproteobacteria bacterium]|jgi:hypothetical protein